jgi:CheY-like chemotaxis protein
VDYDDGRIFAHKGRKSVSVMAGKRILVVEDEAVVGMMLEDMLADLDAVCVGVAASVPEALALLDRERVDAAILDLNLRGERSTPVAEWLSARAIPFAFATGYGDASPETAGAPTLAKPYTQTDLSDLLSQLLPV